MMRDSRQSSHWKGLACVIALQLPFVSAQVADIEKATNASLFWGPYRPNLYFGVRPRLPKSFMGGLLWTRVEDYSSVQTTFRHTCEQHELDGYGWDEYDVRSGGRQTIHDPANHIDITTEFIKFPGGEHGGSWGARIKGTPRQDASPDLRTTVIWYNTLEGLGTLEVDIADEDKDEPGFRRDAVMKGITPELGEFEVRVTEGKGSHPQTGHPSYDEKPLDRTLVHSGQVPHEALWQIKAVLFAHLKGQIDQLIPKYGEDNPPPPAQIYTIEHLPGRGNIHLVQKVFEGAFEFDVIFTSGSAPAKISSQDLSQQIDSITTGFSTRFAGIFKPQAPFTQARYGVFSKSLFSNLLGGIGYFFGDSRVDRSYDAAYEEDNEGFWEDAAEARSRNEAKFEGPSELFTAIPSRPFFPRGFLWDEGFHLLPVIDWDADLTLDIIKSWFNLMDEDGWIGREQILGAEARSKVPEEFQVQYPHYANPPTLFMVITSFLDKLDAQKVDSSNEKVLQEKSYFMQLVNREAALQYLKNLYPLLKRHYFWFRKTQAGDIKSYDREAYSTKEGYRWRGRTPQHILTSGLDDYPRAQPPHPGELHVDLISWMGMMTRAIKRIAVYLGEDDDAKEFAKYDEAIVRNIDDLHWSKKEKAYCDATIDDYEEHALVCHKGYISLFPFLTGLVDSDSKRLGSILDLIEDEEELWSPHGLRSLSKNDENYHTAEDYWRGPVWMPINYLAVSQLLKIAQQKGPHQVRAQKLYTELRKNLVNTVYESWKETGFAWEQYNPETGKGQRTQHFTGWTSLVVKIMAMPDLSEQRVRDEL